MRLSSIMSPSWLLMAAFLDLASAIRMFESNSLNPCMQNSSFSATLFDVIFTPDNGTLAVNINGVSQISGNVTLEVQVLGYGLSVYQKTINPCDESDLKGLCPMNTGDINFPTNVQVPASAINQIPNAIYYIPDLDGQVKVWINGTDGTALACVEADLSNGKTVYQKGVAWSIAVIAGLGLAISAIVSGLGHSNTAAHVASNALALFGYFQAQAFIGMTAVEMPPIVRSWTQNFQWSMGIIRVGFLQTLATWYQRSTGGTPSTYLSSLGTTSVQVAKRSLEALSLFQRDGSTTAPDNTSKTIIVKGIERVGFVAGIEISNIFFTGYVFLLIFILLVTLGVVAFKFICEGLARAGKLSPDKFRDFRNGWQTVLKGILYRIVLIGFPQMVVLCFWELTKRDSAAEVVLGISTILTMIAVLTWASIKVWRIARRSISLHKNPAYILYSDPKALNKWGFLYVQFKATMYYFIFVILFYIIIKGMFIAFCQDFGTVQAVALVIIELALLVTIAIMRPYMDKKTNAFNISIASVNFFNVILLLFFANVFGIPDLAVEIMGIIFFIVNAVFATVLLLMVIWASVWALVSKNPDTRYQPMRDDRGSFIKSQTNLGTTELDALGATARGDKPGSFAGQRKAIDDDDDHSWSSGDIARNSAATQNTGYYGSGGPTSPMNASAPMLAHGARPPSYRSQSPASFGGPPRTAPGGYGAGVQQFGQQQYREKNSSSPSPWQRGVGY